MAWPIIRVTSGGIPVTEVTNGLGVPYEESTNGFGVPVTFVSGGGIPLQGALPPNVLTLNGVPLTLNGQYLTLESAS